jgi:hypothetical protein
MLSKKVVQEGAVGMTVEAISKHISIPCPCLNWYKLDSSLANQARHNEDL